MDARALVEALGGSWRGTHGKARCPAHDDDRPSLSITDGDKGRVLWKCHAGCSQEEVQTALTERGLISRGSTPSGGRQKRRRAPKAIYSYDGPDRDLLFQVVRFPQKKFRQRRPDGKDGWIWDTKGVRRVPYRLPELLDASEEIVFVVEGEKDVETLRAQGLIATCNPGGAGKWRSEYTQYFVGRDVVIVADNDASGLQHAEHVAASLLPVAKNVRIAKLPGLPPNGDVTDWFNAAGSREQLICIIDAAPPYSAVADEGDKLVRQLPDQRSRSATVKSGQHTPGAPLRPSLAGRRRL